jgi:hypothetical protein
MTRKEEWIPAFAGMTEVSAGMTRKETLKQVQGDNGSFRMTILGVQGDKD